MTAKDVLALAAKYLDPSRMAAGPVDARGEPLKKEK